MVPENCRNGMHPDAIIMGFRVSLDNRHDATHLVAISSGTWEYIKHESCNTTNILDEQLHAMDLCISRHIHVQVDSFDGEHILQMYWLTGSQSWRGGDQRNACVRVTQCLGRGYGVLNGRLLWQVQPLFKIKLQNKDGAILEYWLPLALATIPETSGNLDPVSKFVPVRKALSAIGSQVESMGNITSCVHLFLQIATSSMTRGGRNEDWIVNSHIDLPTSNDVYDLYRENCICAQVEGIQGEILTASLIALQSRCKCVYNQHILTYAHRWPQCQSECLK
jgi:hypothetical protein